MEKTKIIGWGSKSPLVKNISKRTKIKPADVSDVLRCLPQAIIDVLISLNPPESQTISFPLISVKYNSKGYMGKPSLQVKKSPSFRNEATRYLKSTGEHK